MHTNGAGVERNLSKAASWFLKSAEQGDAGHQTYMMPAAKVQ
jgi:TPR repeat protein